MKNQLPRSTPAALTLLLSVALGAPALCQDDPEVPTINDPSSYGAWGAPVNQPTSFGWQGGWYSGTRTTRKRNGIACAQVTPAYCGGNGNVAAGVNLSLFGVGFTTTASWDAPPPNDDCDLCAIFLCGNATQTERSEKGVTHSGGKKYPSKSGPKVTTVPNGAGMALKQACNETDEAHAFCCPETNVQGGSQGSQQLGQIQFDEIRTTPDQYGFGASMPAPFEVDLLEIAAFVQIDLRRTAVFASDASLTPEVMGLTEYKARTANELSISNRFQLAQEVIADLGLNDPDTPVPTGRVLASITGTSGVVVTLDLGTVEEALQFDTYRLGNPADVDMDGVVTQADLNIVVADMALPSRGCRGDVNMDGYVNASDVEIVDLAMGH